MTPMPRDESCRSALCTAFWLAAALCVSAAYQAKPLPEITPESCPSFQKSQGVSIGVLFCPGEGRCREIVDSKEFCKLGIVPAVVCVRNDNPYAVTLGASGVLFIDSSEEKTPPLPWWDVVVKLFKEMRLKVGDGQSLPSPEASSDKQKAVMDDFKAKSLVTGIVKPGETLRKVLFFNLGKGEGIYEGARLYISEIYRMDTGEELVFFEFDVRLPPTGEGKAGRKPDP